MHRIGLLILLILGLGCLGCEKEAYDAPALQPVYFEYHYVNHAWGYQNYGWLVDREGTIRGYAYPDGYNLVTHGDYLSQEQLEFNLSTTDTILGKISPSAFNKHMDLIPAAAEGGLGELQCPGADRGAAVFSCYFYESEMDAYRYVLLSLQGDCEQKNLAKKAGDLADWLEGVLEEYPYF
jgi:hypothetical protein